MNWSVSVFLRGTLPPVLDWLAPLRAATESDGVRILECIDPRPDLLQFFVSSLPPIAPTQIIRSIKGRLQYLVRGTRPKAFHRNYRIESVGSTNNAALDAYLSKQLKRHAVVDPRVRERLEALQFHDPRIDLTLIRRSSHGEFLFNLHLVVETADGWNEVSEPILVGTRDMIVKSCRQKEQALSWAAILLNHVHISVGCGIEESPESVGLSILNNLAYVQGMRAAFKFGYYVGTVGNFDRYAIWNRLGS